LSSRRPQTVLGVDLASRDARTAAAIIERSDDGTGRLTTLDVGVSDRRILDCAADVDATGIDAPLGWPDGLRTFLAEGAPADAIERGWYDGARHDVFLRATDRFVWRLVGKKPLVVAADLIAYPALRCAGILSALTVSDRSGADGVFEVYPAAALIRWGIPVRRATPSRLAIGLTARFPGLVIPDRHRAVLHADRDALDAVVAALATLAAVDGASAPIPDGLQERARREGWIHVPAPDAPRGLGG
jgi:predicted nuclease with RNAse H fold